MSQSPDPQLNHTVTSKDVAKLAGVSQSTVSRVFVAGSSVSEKTKQKVYAAAKTLNYRPNAFARSLTTNESKLIGLVFPDADYPIHMKTLQLLSQELMQKGYSAVLIPWQKDHNDAHTVSQIFQYRVDGVIAASATMNRSLYQECQDFNIPIVQYARVLENVDTSYVASDNYGAGEMAAEYLHQLGIEETLYLTGNIPTMTNSQRYEGFRQTFHKLTGKTPAMIEADYDYQGALTTIRDLFARQQLPESVFCATDNLAMAVMDVARLEFGIQIPEQLQIIGFDNIPQSTWLSYQLTTFEQNFERLAIEAVNIITDVINKKNTNTVQKMIPVKLVARGSTRAKAVLASA